MLTDTTITGALDDAIADVHTAAQVTATTLNYESALEDERALVKAAAIRRLVEAGHATSPSAAEKIVEMDEQYALHRARQRDAVIASYAARAAWEAAKARVRHASRTED